MAAVSDFFCYIEKHWEDLCQDIEEGVLRPDDRTSSFLLNRLGAELHPDAERARELRRIFQVGLECASKMPEAQFRRLCLHFCVDFP